MAQDFAKHRPAPASGKRKASTRAATRSEPAKTTHWNWFSTGLVCGVLVALIAYLGIVKLDTEINEIAQNPTTDGPTAKPAINFGFYDELANTEVMVNQPPAATADSSATTAAAETVWYLLQAGSFQDRQDAENRRAKVILMNMSANIVPGVVSGRTWHRVQVGPFAGRREAEEARDVLSESNIDSIPLLMRE